MTSFSFREFLSRFTNLSSKHDHYKDYGWPERLTFHQVYKMYERNDLAKAAVKKTTEKTFQNLPKIVYSEAEDEALLEAFDRLGFWDKVADADEYAQVGGYAGLILRVADGKPFRDPVDASLSLEDLVEVIPVWSEQLQVNDWHTDERDADNYGKPKSFHFNEASLDPEGAINGRAKTANRRAVIIHPDRVIVWSSTGRVDAPSSLVSGYNNLLDMEKISGAGGEGFWKTAAARLNIEIDKDTDFGEFVRQVESQTGKKFQEALDEKAQKLNAGFDSSYISQGMKVVPFSISMPQPKEFFDIPLQAFAAGRSMPVKILVGMQTGERASTEDANEWNNTIMARRNRWTIPSIKKTIQRLEAFGMLKPGWELDWDELNGDNAAARFDRTAKMAEINTKQAAIDGQPIFSAEELRLEAGYDKLVPEMLEEGEEEVL